MKAYEFVQQTHEKIADQPNKTAHPNKTQVVIIPFTCLCIFAVDKTRDRHFTTSTTVTMGGMTVGDAMVKTLRYSRDGQSIETNVTGTLVVFTAKGIKDAIDRANACRISINGLGMRGTGKIIAFEIGETVTLIDPISGDTFTLKGANR